MPEEEQNLSAAIRVARRSVWEQARAAGNPKDETPPPAPTGRETGLNDDPRVSALEGIVRDLAGRLDDLEDDFPEDLPVEAGAGGGVWTGRIVSHDGSVLQSYDFTGDNPDPIENTHIHLNIDTGEISWNAGENEGKFSWEVAESDGAGGFMLCNKTQGDIVVPVPELWLERQLMHTDEEGKLKVDDLKIKTDGPEVGFTFEKPDGSPELVQMKTTGTPGDIYVCGADGGGEWTTPELIFEAVGNSLIVRLVLGDKEYEGKVTGTYCGDD